jgi:methionine synthase I (cobalamin-dependent)
MDKQTILKEYYRAQINALIDGTKDIALLELIYKLLLNEKEENEK